MFALYKHLKPFYTPEIIAISSFYKKYVLESKCYCCKPFKE